MKNNTEYTAEQLRNANEFVRDRDIIDVVTEPDKTYTKDQIKVLISAFRNKEVN